MAWTYTSARAAALKKAQEASARLRRGKAQVVNRVKAAVKTSKRDAAGAVSTASRMRKSGASVTSAARTGVRSALAKRATRMANIRKSNSRKEKN
jgi:hypothetical protein